MSANSIFIARLRGLPVLDSLGDRVGKVRDVVLQVIVPGRPPRAKGLVVELFARHRIFVPMLRIHSMTAEQVVISGTVDTRRFARRDAETLVIDDVFDRSVTTNDGEAVTIYDVSMKQVRSHDWELDKVAVREDARGPFGRRGNVKIIDWRQIGGLNMRAPQRVSVLIAQMEDMKAADVARELHDLAPERRAEVAAQLDDEVLAGALEELPEDEQVALISSLEIDRAADVLEEMDPDDAADLIADLAPDKAEELLGRMEPEDAEDVRTLLTYGEFTAGGMMTPEPVVIPPDATVAEALARIRGHQITPALASMVFVCRTPLDTPTGHYLGAVHFQRLLREPPSTLAANYLDADLQPMHPDTPVAAVSRYFATYNLVVAPVVDADGRLRGAVTVDDVLDHMLPEDWRGEQMDGEVDEVSRG